MTNSGDPCHSTVQSGACCSDHVGAQTPSHQMERVHGSSAADEVFDERGELLASQDRVGVHEQRVGRQGDPVDGDKVAVVSQQVLVPRRITFGRTAGESVSEDPGRQLVVEIGSVEQVVVRRLELLELRRILSGEQLKHHRAHVASSFIGANFVFWNGNLGVIFFVNIFNFILPPRTCKDEGSTKSAEIKAVAMNFQAMLCRSTTVSASVVNKTADKLL